MGRYPQPVGERGSLKWLQRFIELQPSALLPKGWNAVEWLSPVRSDDFSEYRDAAFLRFIGQPRLALQLPDFWPNGGPQWDGIGRSGDQIILVEAKAHLAEFFSSGTKAGVKSRPLIQQSLDRTKNSLGARDISDWTELFYQYANRLAWLKWLRDNGVDARLLFVSFIGDADMGGPKRSDVWQAAFKTAEHALGLSGRHALSRYIGHTYPDVSLMSELAT